MIIKEAHVIGNGRSAYNYQPSPGLKITCNLPPMAVEDVFATCIVDFKMMQSMTKGEITVPGSWILGMRPKLWMEKNPSYYMKVASQIKEFYQVLPSYIPDYTKFSCGHFAVHYTASKHRPDILHMYGFDSIFDFDLTSCSDYYLHSNRDNQNTTRLTNDWRSGWPGIFNEFQNTQFVLHYKHDHVKFPIPDNVKVHITK